MIQCCYPNYFFLFFQQCTSAKPTRYVVDGTVCTTNNTLMFRQIFPWNWCALVQPCDEAAVLEDACYRTYHDSDPLSEIVGTNSEARG